MDFFNKIQVPLYSVIRKDAVPPIEFHGDSILLFSDRTKASAYLSYPHQGKILAITDWSTLRELLAVAISQGSQWIIWNPVSGAERQIVEAGDFLLLANQRCAEEQNI